MSMNGRRFVWVIAASAFSISGCRDAQQEEVPGSDAMDTVELQTYVEDVRIGARDGDDFLSRIGGATLSADGAVLVVTFPQQSIVRGLDAMTGDILWTAGRAGAGPGEYPRGAPTKAGTTRDTLWVFDGMNGRFTLLGASGEFLRSLAARGPVIQEIGFSPQPLAILANGNLVGEICHPQAGENGRPCVLATYEFDGEVARTLARYHRPAQVSRRFLRPNAIPIISIDILPFSETKFVGVSPDGSSILFVDAPAASDGLGSFTAIRMGLGGDTVFSRSHTVPVAELPRMMVDSAASMYAGTEHVEKILATRYGSAITAVLHNPDGSSLLRREDRGEDTVEWIVVDAAGEITARMRLPSAATVLVADENHIWMNHPDSMDVPFLVRLTRQRD